MCSYCGQPVHSLLAQCGSFGGFTQALDLPVQSGGKTRALYNQLSYFCTQTFHVPQTLFSSVNSFFSTFYTGPITTTTMYI